MAISSSMFSSNIILYFVLRSLLAYQLMSAIAGTTIDANSRACIEIFNNPIEH
ncbi:MAG: hypothetical protein AAF215_33190 [Cyanobacteria bacterium P01_A01_bin.123]